MKVISVVGARPQFIKAAPVCRALRERHEEILVHSGQHYDYAMSDVFFAELGIPKPDFDLAVGSGGHGKQTGEMLGLLETLYLEQEPDCVLVYGDTNTTLAGALAAAKLSIPVVHVEAGLRSFVRDMPEEINRVLTDHISTVLCCPTDVAVANLTAEGITEGVALVGDCMLDTARFFAEREDPTPAPERHGVTAGGYFLATLHRAANSDDPARLGSVIAAFGRLDRPVLWLIHPRTRANLERFGLERALEEAANIRAAEPLPYMETIALLSQATGLLTDSGGMQKEAYFFEVPCVTMRDETEWVETVDLGWNTLAGTDEEAIVVAAEAAVRGDRPATHPDVYGDGHAAARIVEALEQGLEAR